MTTLGILGGGQLARMLIQAAIPLGVEVAIFSRKPDSPAGRYTQHEIAGDWADEALQARFAELCDVITLENEFVDAGILQQLEALGVPVRPGPDALATIQDKLTQKRAISQAGLPVPRFRAVESLEDVHAAAEEFGWPVVLKARRDGYDGYGNATLRAPQDAPPALEKFSDRDLLVEEWAPFEHELAVMVLRTTTGQTRAYPVVETVQRDHICHIVRAPAPISHQATERAARLAVEAVEAVGGVGVFGVELFHLPDGEILYNEMAPRPHNSGHYTIEGTVTSQFENHIRAVLGWPLGETSLRAPAAVMVNILGGRQGQADMSAIRAGLGLPGAHVHLYGKRDVRPGRKMGHVTALADSIEEAEAIAWEAADRIQL